MFIPVTTHGKHEVADQKVVGRIVSLGDQELVITSDVAGEKALTAVADVKVTRGGNPCKLTALQIGSIVHVTVRKDNANQAVEIELLTQP
jgi:hypothetical protein